MEREKYVPDEIIMAENDVMYEQYCNSVGAKLLGLDNPGDIDCKRWPWELIQNAKDTVVKKENDKFVDVVFHRYTDKNGKQCLSFSHNGEPFSAKALMGLKWTFSAEKRSEETTEDGLRRDKQSTGRFGTGFLTTHALSRIIDIRGALKTKDKGLVSVDMTLYRNGTTDEELKKGLDKTIAEEQYNAREIEEKGGHPITEFIYHLDNEYKFRPACMGIANLMDNSAQTMTFCPTIRSITIKDEIDQIDYKICRKEDKRIRGTFFQCEFEETKDGNSRNRIFIVNSIEEPNQELTSFKKFERNLRLQLAIEVDGDKKVKPIAYASSPSVYCSLPLIGFERMTLPFYINSNDFEPIEARIALYLNKIRKDKEYNDEKNCYEEKIYPNGINWMILERSISMYEDLIDYLITNGYTALYNIGNGLGQIFDSGSGWTEEERDCLAARYIIPLREVVVSKSIVKTNDGLKSIKNDNLHFPTSTKSDFYEICNSMYGNSMPVFDDLKYWIRDKWSAYKFKDGFEESIEKSEQSIFPVVDNNTVADFIERAGNINSLVLIDQSNPIEWLNSFYKWLSDTKSPILNERRKIVPNRKENFVCVSGERPLKSGVGIEEVTYAFMKNLEIDWDDELLLDGIEHISLEAIKREDVANAIRKQCKDIINSKTNVMEQLLPIITAIPTVTENESRKNFRNKRWQIIEFFTTIYQREVSGEVEINLSSEIWEDTDKWLMEQFLDQVASKKQLETIDESGDGQTDKYCTIEWLNKFVNFLINNGYLHQEELSENNQSGNKTKHWKLIPNEYGEFCSLDQLHTIGNVPRELLSDSFAVSGIDLKKRLIHDRFEINYRLHTAQFQLASIVKELESFYSSKDKALEVKIGVASYIIHLKPSGNDVFDKLLNVYDVFSHCTRVRTEIECSDSSLWRESVNVIANYLANEISDAGSLDKLDERLKNEDEHSSIIPAIEWLDDYIDYISAARLHIPDETLIMPDYYGKLHSVKDRMYDGSCLKTIEELIPILEKGLLDDCPFEEDADFKRNILSHVLKPEFKHTDSAKDDTKRVILGIIDECVEYCYNHRNEKNQELLKDAVGRIVNYFQDETNDSAKDGEYMPNVFPKRNDLAMDLLYDPETRRQLQKMHDAFSSDEIKKILEDKTAIQELIQKKSELCKEVNQLEALKLIEEKFPDFDLKKILDNLQEEQGDFDIRKIYEQARDQRKIQIGDEGECFVYQELCKKYGTDNVKWSNLVTSSIADSRRIDWNGETYYLCTIPHDYDFEVTLTDGRRLLFEVKTTVGDVSESNLFPLNFQTKEWNYIDKTDNNSKYIIARVFAVETSPRAYYLQKYSEDSD